MEYSHKFLPSVPLLQLWEHVFPVEHFSDSDFSMFDKNNKKNTGLYMSGNHVLLSFCTFKTVFEMGAQFQEL